LAIVQLWLYSATDFQADAASAPDKAKPEKVMLHVNATAVTQALIRKLFLFVDLSPARNLICAAITDFSAWLQGGAW
jgi:hypothetical protein